MAAGSLEHTNAYLSKSQAYGEEEEEEVEMVMRQHVAALIQGFPTLHATLITHNQNHLVQLQGTIPIYYQDLPYNIPVAIWLPGSYPKAPPRVFVTPTKDMTIQRPHSLVDPSSGMVSSPYLQAWTFPRSNLLHLVSSLSLVFGLDPPLFSNPSSAPTALASHPLYPNPSWSDQTAAAALRRNLIGTLVAHLQTDTLRLRNAREKETHDLIDTQNLLQRRHKLQLSRALDAARLEKDALEQQLQMILTNNDILELWLAKNDKGYLEFSIDDVFEPCDAWSKQLLECNSVDLAIEDSLYSLDKAVQEGAIPVEAYLKYVRSLSREQFFHRAAALKIREAQIHSQISNIASRASFRDDRRGDVLAHNQLNRALLPFATRIPK